jgi:hypothetical protein
MQKGKKKQRSHGQEYHQVTITSSTSEQNSGLKKEQNQRNHDWYQEVL